MKRITVLTAALLLVVFAGTSAFAWGGGRGKGPGCDKAGYAANPEAWEKFMGATSEIRKELAAKQVQLDALMSGKNPDPKEAAGLSREIFDLREQLRAKAAELGLPGPGNGAGGCPGYGRGKGPGPGYDRGGCWR